MPNLFRWADRENGLGCIIASQITSFGGRKPSHLLTRVEELISVADAKVMGLWGEVEAGLYKVLSPEGSAEALTVH